MPAVAVAAAVGLIPASWRRAGGSAPQTRAAHGRWIAYLAAGGVAAATVGPWLVIVLAACGLAEVAARTWPAVHPRGPGPAGPGSGSSGPGRSGLGAVWLPLAAAVPAAGGLLAVAWEGLKVGALSYGGGFVIIPLMQHDAVDTYHWMTAAQFLNAVALGQITPGPVVQTVAVVGYAAAGVGGGLLAALVAFTPSFLFVLVGGALLRPAPGQRGRPGLPDRGRPGRHRRHRRGRGAARPGPHAPVAARRARSRRGLAARRAARRGQRDRGCRRARRAGLRRRRSGGMNGREPER